MKKFLVLVLLLGFIGVNYSITYAATGYKEARVRQILLTNIDDMALIEYKLKQGVPFEDLAKKYSICQTRKKSGDMGIIKKGTMVEAFDMAIEKTKVGEISAPFRTEFGWHVIKVISKE